jgi:hypothetical protein
MSGPMDQLIKERKRIVQTITKFADPVQTKRELHSLEHVSQIDVLTPEIISSTPTTITMEYFTGVTAFSALEILARNNKHSEVEKLLDTILTDLFTLQESSRHFGSGVYPYRQKMLEITEMLRLKDMDLFADKILAKLDGLEESFVIQAHIPFRDATPKNYTILNESESSVEKNGIAEGFIIGHFDFATFHMNTHQYDDVISVLYHYMVRDEIRDRLLSKYSVDLFGSESALATTILRLGRFWLRRVYYQSYHESLFKKRYKFESIR